MNKAQLLEGQILHQIKKQEGRLAQLKTMLEKKEITPRHYERQWFMCKGAIDQLTLILTCYDNPLSNFLSK